MLNQLCATEFNLLTNQELDVLPTNNLEKEKLLAELGKKTAVAKFRYQHFTAKGIRNKFKLLRPDSFQTKSEKSF